MKLSSAWECNEVWKGQLVYVVDDDRRKRGGSESALRDSDSALCRRYRTRSGRGSCSTTPS